MVTGFCVCKLEVVSCQTEVASSSEVVTRELVCVLLPASSPSGVLISSCSVVLRPPGTCVAKVEAEPAVMSGVVRTILS